MRPLLFLVLAAFGVFSAYALWQLGYVGLWQAGFANVGTLQVLLDLVISSLLLTGYVARECRAAGRPWWPWALLTLAAGSFGTLTYLLFARPRAAARPAMA